jgi:RNA polymerase sigma-70 factor (ECF subfamily)
MLDEAQLISMCAAGDESAWQVFVDKYFRLIYKALKNASTLYFAAISDDDIFEVAQQVFCNIWCRKSLRSLNNPKALPAYLIILSQNALKDFLKKRARYINRHLDTTRHLTKAYIGNPRTEAHNNQLQKELESLIEALPIKERRIIALEFIYGIKHRQIADLMGIPINTVSTIVSRIKKKFKNKLDALGYNEQKD